MNKLGKSMRCTIEMQVLELHKHGRGVVYLTHEGIYSSVGAPISSITELSIDDLWPILYIKHNGKSWPIDNTRLKEKAII